MSPRPFIDKVWPVIRNIIFDWSGTLVDDLPAVWQATNHVMQKAGVEPFTLDRFRLEFQLPFMGFYDKHLPQVPADQLEKWFHDFYRTVRDQISLLPHARDFLDFCRDQGLRIFILSTVSHEHFDIQARNVGLEGFFDHEYLGVRDKRKRIASILDEQSMEKEETMFIGDMQHDVETAQDGGIHSCAVLTGYNRLDQLRQSEPDCIVEHLGELRRLLELQNMQWQTASREMNSFTSGRSIPVTTVGALILNGMDEGLMIRTDKWSGLWGIPGGKIEYGEPAIEALRREILEETGLGIDGIKFEMVQDCIHSDEFYREEHFILLNYSCRCKGKPEVTLNNESREYRWLHPKDALDQLSLNTPTRILLQAVMEKDDLSAVVG